MVLIAGCNCSLRHIAVVLENTVLISNVLISTSIIVNVLQPRTRHLLVKRERKELDLQRRPCRASPTEHGYALVATVETR
jgi:hypothetical protein